MTPNEKAIELVDKFYEAIDDHWNQDYVSKECALILVDKILDILNQLSLEYEYWQEVKQEIEKL